MRKKLFEHARTVALSSDYKIRHGAILVKGNSIIKSSPNKARAVGFVHKHHKNHTETNGSRHAEIGCVMNVMKEKTEGCDIYVARVLRDGKLANSKPCEMCQTVCTEMGINKIYYSIEENIFGEIKLK